MSRQFISALAPCLSDFLKFKHSLGIKYLSASSHLKSLDLYNFNNGNYGNLERNIVENWIAQKELASSSQDRSWISPIKEFGRYLKSVGFKDAYVIDSKYRIQKYHADVYILSNSEIEEFFVTCDNEMLRRKHLGGPYVLPALYRFMYCCGVRCIEARSLKHKDVNLKDGYVDIIQSKGHRDRRLFLSDELIEYFNVYATKINYYFPETEYFFPSPRGAMYSSAPISANFRYIWLAAGFKRDSIVKPRAYVFRHHFACANIIRWSKDGLNIHAMLPYLMSYMGHSSLESTYYYLHLVPDYFSQYSLLASSTEGLIPEVEDYEV